MKVVITGSVTHNNNELTRYKTYDLPDKDAQDLIAAGVATIEGVDTETPAAPEPETKTREKKSPSEPFVAEAIIDPEKRAKLEAEGKLNDETPVVPPAPEKDPESETVVIGGEKSQAQIEEEAKKNESSPSGKPQE